MTASLPIFDPDFAGPAQWAAMYRAVGLQVVPGYMPGEGNGSWKRPLLSSWTAHQNELMTDDAFAWLYGESGIHIARPNMGLITGRCSGNGFVVDLDSHKNPAALAWWNAVLEVENSGLDLETVEQRTGGGGIQKLFLAPQGFVVPTAKTSIGVDIRGQGGFAVLPPSLHESGQHYDWLPGRAPWEIAIEIAPTWLLEAIVDLAEAHGGGPSYPAITMGTPAGVAQTSGEQVLNEFGTVIDGREHLMRDVVWHAVLELYRAAPIKPQGAELEAAMEAAWASYEMKVTTRVPGADKLSGLAQEDRGQKEFARKWKRLMRLWGSPKMEAEAAKPPPVKQDRVEDPAAEFQQAATQAEAAAKLDPNAIFELLDVDQILTMPDPIWQVDGIMVEESLGFIYGPPGCFKSFIALDLALSFVTGRASWWGHAIASKGAVIYVSCEGNAALKFRLQAWSQHYQTPIEGAPFFLIRQALSFLNGADVGKLLATVESAIERAGNMPIAAIFVDTVSRVLPGVKENLQEDMSMFVRACDEVRLRFHTIVVGLHHTNKAGGFRGSTVMPGAGDFLIEVSREERSMSGKIFAAKIKDAPDQWEQSFKAEEVVIGLGGHTALIVDAVAGEAPRAKVEASNPNTWMMVLRVIDEAWKAGKPWSISPQAPDRYAPRLMAVRFAMTSQEAKYLLNDWLARGTLLLEVFDSKSKKKGLRVRSGVVE